MSQRFRVALSYPGERRPFVAQVAAVLVARLGRDRVLYDKNFEAEFARVELDTYLQRLYHDESELVVVFLCAEYEKKKWCGLEWRAIRDLITERGAETVMPLRFDETQIPGFLGNDGYLFIGERQADEVASKILERLGAAEPPPPARHLPRFAVELFGRDEELKKLDAAWLDPSIHVLSLIAFGGVGKTSLIAQWADRLAARDYDGAEYFEWSFFSQGTSDRSTASSDIFLDHALRHFGAADIADSPLGVREKGERLAALLGKRRALLVLDGLEPLQYPPGTLAGELKDGGISALLRGLAVRNAGLCVVTSRESVVDLGRWRQIAAPEWQLEHLSPAAGAALLRSLEIYGSQSELERAVKEVRGHALTLNVIGNYLRRAHGGDVRKRDRVKLHRAVQADSREYAFKAMGSYEKWLAAGDASQSRQLALLRLLGLFDRPVPPGCFAALRAEPPITGITEPLVSLGAEEWNLVASDLVECQLLVRDGENLDAHPLIREYFARQLQKSWAAWREAHGRIFEYLKDSTEHQPATLAGLQPLYQAVYHGCQAGRPQEVCDEVYFGRILRGGEGFAVKKLGAFGADLGAITCFFETPWDRISSSLSEAYQVWLLNAAAYRLRALGRLREAVEPLRAALDFAKQTQDLKSAAVGAGNLSELELTLGDVNAAVTDAEQSMTLADRSGDVFGRMIHQTTLADAWHQAGDRASALALFREAEHLQAEMQPEFPLLYSARGFHYCNLLLAEAEGAAGRLRDARAPSGEEECNEVELRAVAALKIAERNHWLLDIALDYITLGRARLYRAILAGRASQAAAEAQADIDKAVAGFRTAGAADHLPRGLLTRAWLRFVTGDAEGASADLDEAQEISQRGEMRLHLADIALYRARFFNDRAELAKARKLVEECGYGRRLPEIMDLEEKLGT